MVKSFVRAVGIIPVQSIPMDWIERDARTQSRVAIDEETVAAYAELVRDGTYLPPVRLFSDGTSYWIADGWHRFWAHDRAGDGSIDAEVAEGSERDALRFALGANQANGLRRTTADKRRVVEIALNDPEWSQLSDVIIAEMCGVVDRTVGNARKRKNNLENFDVDTVGRLGKDGKKRRSVQNNLENFDVDTVGNVEEMDKTAEVVEETVAAIAEPYERAILELRAVNKRLKQIGESKRGSHLGAAHSGIKKSLAEVAGTIRQNTPVQWCAKCDGRGCASCGQTGVITRHNLASSERASS